MNPCGRKRSFILKVYESGFVNLSFQVSRVCYIKLGKCISEARDWPSN